MEFSNLLGKIGHKEELPENFLAIELTDDIVQAAIWHVKDEITEVVTMGSPIPWNGDAGNLEELVTAVDTTLTKAAESLSETPTKVIFGIPTVWVDGESVKPEKKAYIKKICTDLELKALGYVLVMDSLIRYLRMQEGTPTTAILIQVADTELTIASVFQGKTLALKNISRSDDVTRDVEAGVAHCAKGSSQLPSRFIVFDGMHDLEEVVQNLTLVDWKSKFPFLHIPKVEALAKDIVIKALCVAGGAEVARSIGFTIKEDDGRGEVSPPASSPVIPEPQPIEEAEIIEEPDTELDSLGFTTSDEPTPIALEEDPAESPVESEEDDEPPKPKFALPAVNLPKLQLPKFNLPNFHLPLGAILGILGVATIFFLLAGSLWLFPKATVTIGVVPKVVESDFTLNFKEGATSVDESTLTIPASPVNTSVSGELSVATTGTKQIGDPATGEVTIYNRTLLKKTFTKGTTLTAGNLKFTLDEDVVVASKSAGADYVDVPGKANGKVSANVIGESGNLGSNTEFILGSFGKDSYVAKNDSPLKGGTSKSVSSITTKDKANLLSELKAKLEGEAKGQLQATGGYVYILPSSTKVTKEDYSAKVGDEGDTLKGTLTVSVQGYTFDISSVNALAKSVLLKNTGEYTLLAEPNASLGDGTSTSVNVKTSVTTLPKIDVASMRESLKGKQAINAIESVVNTIPGYAGVNISITPKWLPPRFKSLPRKAENITINIVPTQ